MENSSHRIIEWVSATLRFALLRLKHHRTGNSSNNWSCSKFWIFSFHLWQDQLSRNTVGFDRALPLCTGQSVYLYLYLYLTDCLSVCLIYVFISNSKFLSRFKKKKKVFYDCCCFVLEKDFPFFCSFFHPVSSCSMVLIACWRDPK